MVRPLLVHRLEVQSPFRGSYSSSGRKRGTWREDREVNQILPFTSVSGPESPAGLSCEGVEDVEDFIWENEGEGSLPWDRFSHVFDLVHSGNRAIREHCLDRFEQAINLYSQANNIKPSDPVILGNRCTTYISNPLQALL